MPESTNRSRPSTTEGRWEFYVDRGGTFTDCIGVDPCGKLHSTKVLSSDDAPVVGVRAVLQLKEHEQVPPCTIRMGTTVATNALLERKGVPTLLLISRGFRDLLAIGTQARPDIFALEIEKPGVLYQDILEVDARSDPTGTIVDAPDRESTVSALESARRSGLKSVAIVFLHAYAAPELERRVAGWAEAAGFASVVCSHQAAHELGFLKRGQTAVLDAYLTPLLANYLAALRESLPQAELLMMQSSGNLAYPELFRGPAALLSGPAGGVVAYSKIARSVGCESCVGFDMGGTSTDVSRFDGEYARVYETTISGVTVVSPMLEIHTIAAGGGSVCRYDGHSFSVGPESAGANPGPLCYGRADAEQLTLTDVNVFLGRLQPERFPFALDTARPTHAVTQLASRLADEGHPLSALDVAAGLVSIANENMAQAVRKITLERGHDVRGDALVVFGGAGGQHACAIADLLGIERILFHPLAGLLSAYGMGLADLGWHGEHEVGRPQLTQAALERCEPIYRELERRARAALLDADEGAEQLRLHRRIDLFYAGTETPLTVPFGDAGALRSRFEELHRAEFGFASTNHPLIIARIRLEAILPGPLGVESLDERADVAAPLPAPAPRRHATVYSSGRMRDDVPVYYREALQRGTTLDGPACIVEATGSILLEPGYTLQVAHLGLLDVRRKAPASSHGRIDASRCDPITLRLMSNAFMGVAEQMGTVLRKTARSTNIRERLDFSCALFDRNANLIANAPHIPVHLGAMSESVKAIARRFPSPAVDSAFLINDPAHGGSHLPDITVVTPVFDVGELVFYTASRGHHADVGGITPGSMPAFSSTIGEEGVVFDATCIVAHGRFEEETLMHQLTSGPFPARHPEQNIADLRAQISANQLGARALLRLLRERGRELVLAYVGHVQDDARRWVSEELRRLGDGCFEFDDALDDGSPIGVRLELRDGRLDAVFRCGDEHPNNSNAPRAVTVAAVMYVLRCLTGSHLPLNSGCLASVDIRVPPKSLLDPSKDRAVVSGNVETSQRIVDVLLGALGRAAASQGTMNNLTFGNSSFGYYETIGGGSGAGPGFAGQSGVQCHMTNTRITDVEVLESKYPVTVVRFAFRPQSGGGGRFRGGDGLIREFCFREHLDLSIVSERRVTAPFGLAGGAPGARGQNSLNGVSLPGRYAGTVEPGDRLLIETPGGGGYGAED